MLKVPTHIECDDVILYHLLMCVSSNERKIFTMSNENIKRADQNNTKALNILELAIVALENGLEDANIDFCETLEVIRDYLKSNCTLFDECET